MASLKLTKFGHEFCGPCKFMKPVVEKVVSKFPDDLIYVDVDTYNVDPSVLTGHAISRVPTFILSKDGTEVWRHVGVIGETALEDTIKSHL